MALFGQQDEKGEDTGRGIKLAACCGTSAVAVAGNELHILFTASVGFEPTLTRLALPPGRPVAVSALGLPSVLMSDGTLWCLRQNETWTRVGNALKVES